MEKHLLQTCWMHDIVLGFAQEAVSHHPLITFLWTHQDITDLGLPLVSPSQPVSPLFSQQPEFLRKWAGDSNSSMESCWGKEARGIWEAALVCRV